MRSPLSPWVLGVDSGGSGMRVAIARPDDGRPVATVASDTPARIGPAGVDAGHFLELLLPAARELLSSTGADGPPSAVAVGAAGMATLGDELRARLPGALADALGARRLALAADAVTAYAGALGQQAGAVVVAGTGLIAVGTDLGPAGRGWRRADGWGHLLGDCGSGAWIGRAGLEAALRAHDGRAGGSAALLARLEAVFGPAAGMPGLLYPRADRAAVLARFAPEVGRCAAEDPVAGAVLREAARSIAEAAAAVRPEAVGCRLALTGGLFRMGEPLLAPLREELARQLPDAEPVEPAGDPLDGALGIAAALASGRLALPVDSRMLQVTGGVG
ncbi:N-acetylglucosamine kinase [Streptomyces sp. bgisy100]|uniref:N-acetylglucosamine kinase n=1 Tax=Streptomyces sp. bgisy100 TaxID=3413783 RepID=UPI003D72DFB5